MVNHSVEVFHISVVVVDIIRDVHLPDHGMCGFDFDPFKFASCFTRANGACSDAQLRRTSFDQVHRVCNF